MGKCFHGKRGHCGECEKEIAYARKNGWEKSYEHQLNQHKHLSGLVDDANNSLSRATKELEKQNKKHSRVIAWLLGR